MTTHSKRMKQIPSMLIIPLLLMMTILVSLASTSAYYLDTSRLELQVSPQSHTASGVVKVTSNSTQPIRLRVIPKLWTLNRDGVLVYQEPPAQGFNLLENIGINPREFTLLPGKTRLVRFLVKAPEHTQNAEYPFQLYFEPVSLLEQRKSTEATGIHNMLDVIPVFTTTVYVYQGNPMPDVKVDQFSCGFDPKSSSFDVKLDLSNPGNKHARLFGNVLISEENANQAQEPLDVFHLQNSTLIIVFPNSKRWLESQLKPSEPSNLHSGNYRMELQLVDERNTQAAVQSTCRFTVSKQ